MARIAGEIVIGRPVDVVFDYVADQTNEPRYNPRMLRVEKITPGRVQAGTQFRSAVARMGRTAELQSKVTGYDRPNLLAIATTMDQADFDYTLTFEPAVAGTRMQWSGRVQTTGAVRLLGPLIIWMGSRQERQIWENLKDLLERTNSASPEEFGPADGTRRAAALFRRLAADVDVKVLPAIAESADVVSDHDLAGLPEPAQRYMRNAGVIGRPADWSLQMHSRGKFRLALDAVRGVAVQLGRAAGASVLDADQRVRAVADGRKGFLRAWPWGVARQAGWLADSGTRHGPRVRRRRAGDIPQ